MNREKVLRAAFFTCIAHEEKPSRRNVQKRIAESSGGKTFSTAEIAAFLSIELGLVPVIYEREAKIDPVVPPCRNWHIAKKILDLPGLYAIYDGKKCVYLGSSRNIALRLRGHKHRSKRSVIKVKYHVPGSFTWLSAEARLINRINPPLNVQFARNGQVPSFLVAP